MTGRLYVRPPAGSLRPVVDCGDGVTLAGSVMEPPLGEERVEPFWKRETSISSPRRRGTGGHNATALSHSAAEDCQHPMAQG